MRWAYRAADAAGREARGSVSAATAADAIAQLQGRALWVIELSPVGGPPASDQADGAAPGDGAALGRRLSAAWHRWAGADDESLAVATRAAATLLAAGVTVDRALDFAAGHSGERRDGGWAAVFRAMRTAVRAGASLADAIQAQPRLPAFFAPSVAAAEATGTLAETFAQLAGTLERSAQVRARIRSALVYPVVLGLSSIVGTLVILLIVVPRFSTLLTETGSRLPLSTRLLVSLSSALSAGGWLLLPTLLVGMVWWQRTQRDPAQRAAWDARRLRWPVFGAFERQRDTARYLGTLALALASGVSLLRAMALARATVRNTALAAALAPAEARVRDGGTLAGALRESLPPLAVRLLEAGEAGGDLAALARRAADAAEESAERQLGRVVALIEPVMILGFGGLVGFVALALLQAIYGINAGLT